MELGLLEAVAGAVLLTVANAVYFDMKRKGQHGFRRLLAFWFGNPVTWATFFLMREGSLPQVEPPPDDEQSLLTEVRRDRARRIAAGSEQAHESSPEADAEEK
jgi:hypothetical protein